MSETEYVVSFGEHPSIDDCGALREKVVRCRDCAKWHYFDYKDGVRYGECDEWRRADSCCVPATREDGFCYLAKLKEGRRMTNYEKLFGTPERATETMRDMCHNATACACCPLLAQDVEFCKTDSIESLFVWLESEVCDD